MTRRASLACLAVCAVSRAGAQEDSSAALPVTVKVAPAYAFSGMAFTVSGTSVPYGDAQTVAITVTRISPAPKPGSEVSATATMDNAGKFAATITVTRNSMVIDHTFHRTRPGDNNKGIYMLKIRACNPSCS